ncbi:biotin--[acetyl-CoA-carboxylase] ligase [Deltaproteobacteria bacterium TL4]
MNTKKNRGHRIIRLESVDSTNSYLLREKTYLQHHGLVVTTERQTAGRGRMGRQFISLPGKNLTFSVVLHTELPIESIGIYSLMAGIAVARVLELRTRHLPRLKWPNDVLIEKRKICGILLESTTDPETGNFVLIVGIGVNCYGSAQEYPEELRTIVTTLEQESSQAFEREAVFQEILLQLSKIQKDLEQGKRAALLEEWLDRSQALGQSVRYETQDGWKEGRIEGLASSGYLLIFTPEGRVVSHVAGDVIYL